MKYIRTHNTKLGGQTLGRLEIRITSRAILVLMVLSVRKCYWLLEQPSTSKLVHHPELKYLLDVLSHHGYGNFFQRLLAAQSHTRCSSNLEISYLVGWAAGAERVQS